MTAPPGDLVHFSRPWFDEREEKAVREAVCGQVSGDGPIGRRVEPRRAELLGARRGLRVVPETAR